MMLADPIAEMMREHCCIHTDDSFDRLLRELSALLFFVLNLFFIFFSFPLGKVMCVCMEEAWITKEEENRKRRQRRERGFTKLNDC